MLTNRPLKAIVAAISAGALLLLVVVYVNDENIEEESAARVSEQADRATSVPKNQLAQSSESDDSRQANIAFADVPAVSIDAPPGAPASVANPITKIDAQVDQDDSEQETFSASDAPSAVSPSVDNTVGLVPRFWTLGSATLSTSVGDFVQIASDFNRVWNGTASVALQAIQPILPTTTAGVVQVSSAEPFRDRRLRYSGFLQVESMDGSNPASAMIWIRADDATGRVVAFQNTMGRLRFPNSAWQKASIVIDIPPGAFSLHYGASLVGSGSVRIDSLSFEEVSEETPLTSRPFSQQIFNRVPAPNEILTMPTNLDFEETRPASELQ